MNTVVFKALLRPPVLFGVPTQFLILEAMAITAGFIFLDSVEICLYAIPFHITAWYLTNQDPYLFEVWLVSRTSVAPVPNKRFWGRQSYAS